MPRISKRQSLADALQVHGWAVIGRAEWDQLRSELPGIAESSLREWLHDAGLPVEQPFRGLRTKSLAELEDSLLAMTEAYERDVTTRKTCREIVIAAKERARFASRNPKVEEAKRLLKEEMVHWMLVWLDDPAMFPAWARLRMVNFAAPDLIR